MLIATIVSFLVGGVLGLRFKVIVLVPAIGLAWAAAAINGIAREDEIWRLMFALLAVATFLQLGYVGGSILRSFISVKPAKSDRRRVALPTSANKDLLGAGAEAAGPRIGH